jgi:tyrosyl-tRNA synthetase
VYLNNEKIDDEAATVAGRTLPNGMAVLRRGKKTLAGVFVEAANAGEIRANSGDTPGMLP